MDFKCQCGATCSADESQAGQTIKCAACGQDVPVPAAVQATVTDDIEIDDDVPSGEGGESLAVDNQSIHESAREQFPKGDVDEMIRQLTGRQPGEAAPAKTSKPAPKPQSKAVAEAATALSDAPAAPAGPAKPKTRLDYARHHFGFKRIFWPIGLAVGVLLMAMAVWGFWPRGLQSFDEIPTLEELAKENKLDLKHPVRYRQFTHSYLIEDGAPTSLTHDGNVIFVLDGVDILAPQIDDWAEAYDGIAEQVSRKYMLWFFGAACGLSGGLLFFFGLWMMRDVSMVNRSSTEESPAEASAETGPEATSEAGATDSGDDSAVAELLPPDDEAKS
jgi:hypothetical protein